MEEELREIHDDLRELVRRIDGCRKSSIPLQQALDAVRTAGSRVRMELADRKAASKVPVADG